MTSAAGSRGTRRSRVGGARIRARLDANEAPWDLPPRLRAAALAAVARAAWNRYPPADQGRLREALARYAGVPPAAVVAGNGSDELIQLVMLALGPARGATGVRTVAICPPTFGGYADAARAAGLEVRAVPLVRPAFTPDWPALAGAARDPRTLVVLCRPNNPTGTTWPREALEGLLAGARGPVVVDEAYAEFAGDDLASALAARTGPAAGALRTFSKAAGLAGLRLGYLVGNPALVDGIERVRMPFNVGVPAVAVALEVLAAPGFIRRRIARLTRLRDHLAAELQRRPGVRVVPSVANFVAFSTEAPAEQVWRGLRARGVSIRRFDDPAARELLRVSVGRPAEQAAFLAALDETLAALETERAAPERLAAGGRGA